MKRTLMWGYRVPHLHRDYWQANRQRMGIPAGQLRYLAFSGCISLVLSCASQSAWADFAIPAHEQKLEIESSASTDTGLDASFTPTLWTNEEGLTTDGFSLLTQIRQSINEGLDPERYQFSAIDELVSENWHPAVREPVDQLMATAFEQLITDLGQGLIAPREAQRRWYQTPQAIDPEHAYLSLQIPGNSVQAVIEQHRPAGQDYFRLGEALVKYREIAATGGWPYIQQGKTIRPGMRDARVAYIESRLSLTGDLPAISVTPDTGRPLRYSKATVAAVKKFQKRHGLAADGVIGPKTLASLNTPVTKKIEAIKLNLERLRWLPRDLGERHIITNIADYSLRVMDGDKAVLKMPVVVGKKKFKTPIFSDEVEFLVVNPTWTVPKSILYRELLPAERRNPGYLARKNFELIREENGHLVVRDPNSIDRSEYRKSRFRYTARQKPGKRNALGKVKFIFPNKYSIYLHDTPARSLFRRNTRAFSHGCVRVGHPKALAETLLGFEGWNEEKFEAAYKKEKQTFINLKNPIKNHITYLTSWVDGNYQVHFRPDIYEHDVDLAQAIKNPRKISWPTTILAELGK